MLFKLLQEKLKKNSLKIIIFLSIFYPFILSFYNILNSSIPFWFDPARDFFLALDNLKKPTLLGPPSGIPGIFYGPYWIWMISVTLLFSKDPRLGAGILLLLPYFTIFPYVILKLAKVYSKKISLLLWLLFIYSSQIYTTFLWNPHLTPLLFLLLFYLLVTISLKEINGKTYLKIFLAGGVCGLILNFHISFGLGIFFASILYLGSTALINLIINKHNIFLSFLHNLFIVILFIFGFSLTLLPYMLFELRHNFLQTRTLIKVLTNAILYNSASVGQTGLKPMEIISNLFIERTAELLAIKNEYVLAIYALILSCAVYLSIKKRISFSGIEKNIILYSTFCLSVLLFLFVSSKNPVWKYHFIGIEIIIIFIIGIVVRKSNFLLKTLSFWTIVLTIANFFSFLSSIKSDPYAISSLGTKKYTVEKIYMDAANQSFSILAYSPAIYTYDFDYIIKWLGEDIYKKLPEQEITKAAFVYLIIPKTSEAIQADFINFKTPNRIYQTVNEWKIPDGTLVIKRELFNR